MTPRALLNILAGLLLLAALGAGAYAVWSYRAMAVDVAELKPLKAELAALKDQHEALAAETIKRAEFDQALRDRRQTVSTNLDKVTHEDPVARDYLAERVPDSVRDAVRSAYLRPIP